MSATQTHQFTNLMRKCNVVELAELLDTVAKEMRDRVIAERTPPPTEGSEMLSLLYKGRLMPKAETSKGKASLRVVRPDQRPKQMQWNEANKSWG